MKKLVERTICDYPKCIKDKRFTCRKCEGDYCDKHCGRMLQYEVRHNLGPIGFAFCDSCYKKLEKWLDSE